VDWQEGHGGSSEDPELRLADMRDSMRDLSTIVAALEVLARSGLAQRNKERASL
jgi:hypothetical protein